MTDLNEVIRRRLHPAENRADGHSDEVDPGEPPSGMDDLLRAQVPAPPVALDAFLEAMRRGVE